MKKFILSLATLAIMLLGYQNTLAQGSADYGSGIKVNLNPEGTKFIRFITWHQIWARSIENNPGTLVNGKAESTTSDIGIRRSRFLAYAQISPRYMVLTHWGINNQTFVNGGGTGTSGTGGYGAGKKPQMFIHDAWNEYHVILPKNLKTGKVNKFTMSLGAGLHYMLGVSRLTMGSTLNFLMVDSPIFSWPLIENSDQFARQMGFFAKGKAGKLEYRLSLNKPFSTNIVPLAGGPAVDNNQGVIGTSIGNKWSTAGYLEYQFLEQESNLLPFKVGTYLGTKKVFNLGVGFYNNPDGTKTLATNVSTPEAHNIGLFAADAFLDMPIGQKEKGMAITAYTGYFNYNFGPNYLRNIGIMNEGTVDPNYDKAQLSNSGVGNARALIGTGEIVYAQAGLLLPKGQGKSRFQVIGAITNSNFKALKESGTAWDLGINWFIDGHHAKITGQYSSRPVYVGGNVLDHRGEFILQTQIYL
jgi:hypothetical protein